MIFCGYLTLFKDLIAGLVRLPTYSRLVFVECEDSVESAFSSFGAEIHHTGKNSPATKNQPKIIDLNGLPNFVANHMASIRCLMAES